MKSKQIHEHRNRSVGKRFEVEYQLENILLVQLPSSQKTVGVSESCSRHLCSVCFEMYLDLHALKKILYILQKVLGISWLWGKIKVCKNEGHRLQGRVLDGYLQDELFMGSPVAQALLFKDAA